MHRVLCVNRLHALFGGNPVQDFFGVLLIGQARLNIGLGESWFNIVTHNFVSYLISTIPSALFLEASRKFAASFSSSVFTNEFGAYPALLFRCIRRNENFVPSANFITSATPKSFTK